MRIELPNGLMVGYYKLLRTILRDGTEYAPRGLPTIELIGTMLYFPDAAQPMLPVATGRKLNTRLAAIEALHLLGGVSNPDQVRAASSQYTSVMVNPNDLDFGAYGPRVADQMSKVVQQLVADPWTRRAVVSIWDQHRDLARDGDQPCTLTLQFLRRGHALHLITTMRSNDAWRGTPYDVFMFTQLQQTVARLIDVPVGSYTHQTGSLHLYRTDLDAVLNVRKPAKADVARYRDELPSGLQLPDNIHTVNSDDWSPDTSWNDVKKAAQTVANGHGSFWDITYNNWYVRQAAMIQRRHVT